MAEITANGITPAGLTGMVERVEGVLREALGADLSLEPETPQGQIAGVQGIVFAEIEELAVHVAAGQNIESASGRQVDDYGALMSLPRRGASRTVVTGTCLGTAGVTIPLGSRVRTAAGAVFYATTAAIIPAGGSIDVVFSAVEAGPVVVGVGELSEIQDAVVGWTSVFNAAAGVAGRYIETDAEYRRRYREVVGVHARDALETIRARVLDVDGVTACLVRDNSESVEVTLQGVTIPGGTILVVVEGGADAEVAAAIMATKPPGVSLMGTVHQVAHPGGFNVPIRFRRVAPIPIAVAVTVRTTAVFPSTGLATIRSNLVAWAAGTWNPGAGIFDQAGVGIGEALDQNRILSPIQAVPGHQVTAISVTRVGGGALGAPNLDERFTLASDNITLSLAD